MHDIFVGFGCTHFELVSSMQKYSLDLLSGDQMM